MQVINANTSHFNITLGFYKYSHPIENLTLFDLIDSHLLLHIRNKLNMRETERKIYKVAEKWRTSALKPSFITVYYVLSGTNKRILYSVSTVM